MNHVHDRKIERYGGLVGSSPRMKRVFDLIEKAAKVDVPVLISGETGTGKDLIAREIHSRSRHKHKPYVPVNTGAISRELVASELFGHIKGAFTGANEARAGRFKEADGGTLFLDEIGTMEERVQVSLLRVLESGVYRPVGAKLDDKVAVRVIAATNDDLEEAVANNSFRGDLLHRLQVVRIDVPPLRETPEEIPMLAHHFLDVFIEEFGYQLTGFTSDCLDALSRYSWTGNARELRNVIAHAAVMAEEGLIDRVHLPDRFQTVTASSHVSPAAVLDTSEEQPAEMSHNMVDRNFSHTEPAGNGHDLEPQDGVFIPIGSTLDDVQRAYILKTLDHCGNNKTKAAKMLGVSRKTLYDRLVRWGMNN